MRQAVQRSKGQKAKAEDAKTQWKEAGKQRRKVRSLLALAVVGPLSLLCLLYPLHSMGYLRLFSPAALSKAMANPQATESLDLTHQYLETVPEGIDSLKNLTNLTLDQNRIQELPDSLFKLSKMRHLSVQYNALKTVPPTIGELSSLESLDLAGNHLGELPEQLFKLPRLETLVLSDNNLTRLPEDLGKLSSLKILEIKKNDLSTLPQSVSRLSNLEVLNLVGNKLTSLPDLSGLKNLKSLALQNTGLSQAEVQKIRAQLSGRNVVITI